MRMLKQILFGALFAATAFVTVPHLASAQTKVIISMSVGVNQLPTLVGIEKGYFKEEGVEVEIKPVVRGGVAIEALAAGSIQLAEAAHVPFMAAVSKGIPLIGVGVVSRGFFGKIVASNEHSNIKTLADLKGKRIGTQMGTGMHTVIRMLFEKQGVDEKALQITNLRVSDMPAAMATSSNFDVVIGWEPHMQRIVQAGRGKEVISAAQIMEMAGITYPFILCTTQKYLSENPKVVQAVVNGYAKAHKFMRNNKDKAVEVYTGYLEKTGAKLEKDIARYIVLEVERFGGVAFNDADWNDIKSTRDFLIKQGELKSLPDLDKIIDAKIGQKAEAAVK